MTWAAREHTRSWATPEEFAIVAGPPPPAPGTSYASKRLAADEWAYCLTPKVRHRRCSECGEPGSVAYRHADRSVLWATAVPGEGDMRGLAGGRG